MQSLARFAVILDAARWRGGLPRVVAGVLLMVLLAGCDLGGLFTTGPQQPQQPLPEVSPSAAKVGVILPLTGQGETARIGTAMKQAAELALFDAGSPGITLITKDTGGTAEGAAAAARAALAEGAEILLGPLLANEVQAVSPVARAEGVPVIAFSTLSAVAGPGTYLLSFLPEEEVANVVRYAAENGRRNIAALVPQSPFGSIVERALGTSAKVYGARLVAVERHAGTPPEIEAAAREIVDAVTAGRVQALMVPVGGEQLNQIGRALQQAGFQPDQAKLLGTGQWDDPQTALIPVALGGWYPGVAPELIGRFEQRYRQTYGSAPPRIASLAYDAVSLAIILGRDPPGARFSAEKITNPEGFQGVNGLFRFRPTGLSERGLAILEVTPTGPQVVAPAPQRFSFGF